MRACVRARHCPRGDLASAVLSTEGVVWDADAAREGIMAVATSKSSGKLASRLKLEALPFAFPPFPKLICILKIKTKQNIFLNSKMGF